MTYDRPAAGALGVVVVVLLVLVVVLASMAADWLDELDLDGGGEAAGGAGTAGERQAPPAKAPRLSPEARRRARETLAAYEGEDLKRYEAFRRSMLTTKALKKVLGAVTGSQAMHDDLWVVVGGAAKVLVGELVTEAKANAKDDDGPLKPQDVRDAYQRLLRRGALPTSPSHTKPRPLMR